MIENKKAKIKQSAGIAPQQLVFSKMYHRIQCIGQPQPVRQLSNSKSSSANTTGIFAISFFRKDVDNDSIVVWQFCVFLLSSFAACVFGYSRFRAQSSRLVICTGYFCSVALLSKGSSTVSEYKLQRIILLMPG